MNKPSTETPKQTDAFGGYDTQTMLAASSDEIYKAGLLYFKDNRVIEHYQQQNVLYGRVEGGDSAFPYTVELSHDDAGHLHGRCDCTADHTTANNKSTVSERLICKHAVATLLAFSESSKNSQLYSSAKDIAIRDRIKRGQTEVNVTHVDGLPAFGTWTAASIVSTANVQQSYTVNIRSVSEKVNACTCLDLANNQLATCKHIEAVLHQLAKENKNFPRPAPKPFVYRSFGLDADLRVQRTGGVTEATSKLIDRFFDAQGLFKGELPSDFFKFTDLIFGQDDILIGDDARQLVQSLVIKQANQVRTLQTHQQVMASGGKLPGVNATLYPYQLEGVAFLAANGRGLLADDMGLGKTLQAIAGAMWLTHNSGAKKVLIVCPASLKHQWAREIEKFTGQSSQIIQGGPAKRHAQYTQDKTFFIVNYELVLRDLSVINEVLAADLMILDEAQRIKNWRTKIATAIKLVHSQYAFVLTGTPLENRLEDLYSLMQVVSQDVLGPLWRYLSDYHILDEGGKIQGYRNLAHLRQRIGQSMMRRNRTIVADQLPGRTTLRLDVMMSKKQIELHDSAISTAGHIANIAKTRPLTPSERNRLMASLQQARMACDAAGLVDKKTKGSPKLNELKTLVEDLCIDGGRKMVVFSQWRTMTTMIEDMLRHMGVGCVHLHGGIPTNKRGQLMDDFASDDAIKVFISTDAGGSGLNLQSASVLVNMDIPWNPAVLEQRNARIHRLGQTNKVQIVLMIAENSYEQRVFQLVSNKQDLFDNVIDPEGGEDVVGISKKTLTEVVDDLAKEAKPADEVLEKFPAIDLPEVSQKANVAPAQSFQLPSQLQSDDDNEIKEALINIGQQFGNRIEQILAKGGGLLIILSEVDTTDNEFLDSLKLSVPAAIVDVKTLHQLQQMGVNPLSADSQTIDLPAPVYERISPWVLQANEKLDAAQTLLEQKITGGVMELICSAIASMLTEIAQSPQLMPIEQVPVWLYSEAIPAGLLTLEQTYIVSQVIGLRLANAIPNKLLWQCFADTKELIETLD